MPIYRCSRCGHVAEAATAGTQVPCQSCSTPATVFDTVFYVQKLLERYTAAVREIKALKAVDDIAQTEQAAEAEQDPSPSPMHEVDLLNTSFLATAAQHAPIEQWLKSRQIEAQFDHANVDTTGYFDDAARMLGDRLDLFGELIDRVSYAYRKSHTSVNLDLSSLSQKDVQTITAACRQLHSQTLFSRYHYQKPEKVVRLTLQSAPNVRQFFDGGWLEWYALIELLQSFQARKLAFSCARGVKVEFANEDLHELDVVALPAGQSPICIECKTGEFRREIDKYQRLRKRLGIERSRFIVCASDISHEQATSFTAMYDLTFVNLSSLGPHLATLN